MNRDEGGEGRTKKSGTGARRQGGSCKHEQLEPLWSALIAGAREGERDRERERENKQK